MIPNVQRTRRWLAVLAAIVLLGGGLAPAALAERPPAPRLLPETTVAMIQVANAPEMAEKFMNTSAGRMSQDPQLKPLIGNLFGAVVEATAELKDQIGLSLPELLAIPQGEVAVALVAPKERPLALVVVLDAGGQLSNARKLLERGTAELDRSGARKSEETVAGTKFTIYDGVGPRNRKAIYFEKDATIVLGSDLDVLKELLAVWNGGEGKTLANNQDFAAIMQRCRGAKDEPPQVIWFADPIEIVRKIGENETNVQVALALFPALGVDGLSAVGGSWILDTAQFNSVMHAHILLETPRSGIIKMIALRSGEVQPEAWVPADVAGYSTLHWDIQETYQTLAKVIDSFRGEGSLARDLQGFLGMTGIDVEKDIINSLDGRITMVNRIQRPVTLQSSAILLGLKLKETEPVEKSLEKIFKLAQGNLIEETHAGKKYYRVKMPPQFDEMPVDQRPPTPAFGVLDDYLLATNNVGLYQTIATTAAEGSAALRDELEYKLVASKIRRQPGGDRPAMITISRPEEGMRFIYELATAQRTRDLLRREAPENPFFKSLDTALEESPLPPFSVLQQYLSPAGGMVVDDETGIHYMGFELRRESE